MPSAGIIRNSLIYWRQTPCRVIS